VRLEVGCSSRQVDEEAHRDADAQKRHGP
jgi:hypothetical protein